MAAAKNWLLLGMLTRGIHHRDGLDIAACTFGVQVWHKYIIKWKSGVCSAAPPYDGTTCTIMIVISGLIKDLWPGLCLVIAGGAQMWWLAPDSPWTISELFNTSITIQAGLACSVPAMTSCEKGLFAASSWADGWLARTIESTSVGPAGSLITY